VLAIPDRGAGDGEMRGRRHDDYYRVRRVEQTVERWMCLDPELGFYLLRAIAPRLDESAQLNAGEIAQNSYVVEP
jgi:hypothetical protein